MDKEELDKMVERVSYKSCVDSYMNSRDREDIVNHWVQCLQNKNYAQARGVEKALEIIDLIRDLNAKKE
jgi:hypothetical protein